MRATLSRWFRKGSLAAADQVVFSAAGFVSSVLIGRWTVPETYGRYALMLGWFYLFASAYTGLVVDPVLVLGPTRFKDRAGRYVGAVFGIHLAVSVAVVVVVGLARLAAGVAGAGVGVADAALSIAVGLAGLHLLYLAKRALYVRGQLAASTWTSVVYGVVLVAAIAMLHAWRVLGPETAFYATAVAGAAACAAGLPAAGIDASGALDRALLGRVAQEHTSYGGWLAGTEVTTSVQGLVFLGVVGGLAGAATLGGMRALQNLYSPIMRLVTAISMVALPRVAGRVEAAGERAGAKDALAVSVAFAAPAALWSAVMLIAPGWLVSVLYGGVYDSYAPMLRWLAVVPLAMGLASGAAVLLRAVRRPKVILKVKLASGVVMVLGGWALTAWRGGEGAFIALAAYYAVDTALLWWLALRRPRSGAAEAVPA
ncbi:MAG: hypothetical protein FDZ70_01995 [Actinobacteria bacterium]|nr:MAG: hypothetical protein FDZ70_01995 [Actinomycetota bacterium]